MHHGLQLEAPSTLGLVLPDSGSQYLHLPQSPLNLQCEPVTTLPDPLCSQASAPNYSSPSQLMTSSHTFF